MTSFLMYLSNLIATAASTPYLDGYFAGVVAIIGTVVMCALVIHLVYEFMGDNHA